jgi:hypothetical protein
VEGQEIRMYAKFHGAEDRALMRREGEEEILF